MTCPNCGATAEADANFCVVCGTSISAVCPSCGAANVPGDQYCISCGHRLLPASVAASQSAVGVPCPRCGASNPPGDTYCFTCGAALGQGGQPQSASAARPAGIIEPAGFLVRLAAGLIDLAVILILRAIVAAILPESSLPYVGNVDWGSIEVIYIVMHAVYFTVGVAVFSTTLGKVVLRLRVERTDGSRIGLGRALGRYFSYYLSALLLFIGFLMVGYFDDKRGLHDRICDTRVVRWTG